MSKVCTLASLAGILLVLAINLYPNPRPRSVMEYAQGRKVETVRSPLIPAEIFDRGIRAVEDFNERTWIENDQLKTRLSEFEARLDGLEAAEQLDNDEFGRWAAELDVRLMRQELDATEKPEPPARETCPHYDWLVLDDLNASSVFSNCRQPIVRQVQLLDQPCPPQFVDMFGTGPVFNGCLRPSRIYPVAGPFIIHFPPDAPPQCPSLTSDATGRHQCVPY